MSTRAADVKLARVLTGGLTFDFKEGEFRFRDTSYNNDIKFRAVEAILRSEGETMPPEGLKAIARRLELNQINNHQYRKLASIHLGQLNLDDRLRISFGHNCEMIDILHINKSKVVRFYVISSSSKSVSPGSLIGFSDHKLSTGQSSSIIVWPKENRESVITVKLNTVSTIECKQANEILSLFTRIRRDLTSRPEWYISIDALYDFDFTNVSEAKNQATPFNITFDATTLMVKYSPNEYFKSANSRHERKFFSDCFQNLVDSPTSCYGLAQYIKNRWLLQANSNKDGKSQ